ncbi:protein translocase subunit SecD [Candidatus Latescibacterota bacterium]
MAQRNMTLRSSSKEKYSHAWKISFIAILVLFSLWKLYPSVQYYSMSDTELSEMDPGLMDQLRSKALNLGLDLQGGIHLVMEVNTSGMDGDEAADAVNKAMLVISNRVDQFGLAEPIVQRQGANRIIIELPGMRDVERAKTLIGQTARLEFKLLKSDEDIKFITDKINFYLSGEKDSTAVADSTATNIFEEQIATDDARKFTGLLKFQQYGEGVPSFEILVAPEDIPRVNAYLKDPGVQEILESAGVVILWGPEEDLRDDDLRKLFLVNEASEMTGEMIQGARVSVGAGMEAGRSQINLETTSEGTRLWARISGANIDKRLAIVLDNIVHSSPRFTEKIYGGSSRITGAFTREEARDLSIVLRAGALPASVEIIEDRTVGPSLGADSINKSKVALIIGMGLVVVFMIVYYTAAGVIAIVALLLNMLFILAYLAYFRATLTLPGMAGIILTIGMAVDANVLIFERIREELRLGNTTRVSVDNGYRKVRWTILDSNITTFLTAIILYNFGTGPIRGFALTLMVGIVASVFTALFVTRVIFDILTHKVNLSKISIGMIELFVNTNYKFVSIRRKAFIFSGLIILAGIVSLVVNGGPKYSIDFLGGSLLELHFDQPLEISEIRDALSEVEVEGTDFSTSEIKFIGTSQKDILIRIVKVGDMKETSVKVKEALARNFEERIPSNRENWLLREELVGPSIGEELKGKALWAILFSLIVLVIYITIRFEFKFSIGALLAIVHDVVITIGIFSLLGKEISLSIIAALLTIVGYSLNDTIVVFDRIREKLSKGVREGYLESLNISVNQTLGRTVITSLTTLLTVISLFLFGGDVIHDFSFAMLIGVIVGTYSSIFVATPILAEWYIAFEQKIMQKKNIRKR